MIHFLEHLERIFEFVLKETTSEKMIDILHEKIRDLIESYVTLRDAENFVAYFKCILSLPRIPKKMAFERDLVQAFINRTCTGLTDNTLDYRTGKLYECLENTVGKSADISEELLEKVSEELSKMKKPTLERLMERTRIATILKWLQGPLYGRFSYELQDCIVFFATVYGEYKKNLPINVEWQPYRVSAEDMKILDSEYRVFEIAIIEALQTVREARATNPDLNKYEEQFQIVLSSLDNLVQLEDAGKLNTFDSFKDRLIVSTSLIYIQDDFVEKDAELKKLIQLFVSLYFKYRDKRYKMDTSIKARNKQH